MSSSHRFHAQPQVPKDKQSCVFVTVLAAAVVGTIAVAVALVGFGNGYQTGNVPNEQSSIPTETLTADGRTIRKAAVRSRDQLDRERAERSRDDDAGNLATLRVGYTNIRGNMEHIELRNMIANFDVFALAETHLNPGRELPEISGYLLHRQDRVGHGGGVAVYVRDTVAHRMDVRISGVTSDVEQLWLRIQVESEEFQLGVVYNPPPYVSNHLESWWKNIIKFINEGCNVISVGDFNLDLGDLTNSAVRTFNERLVENGLEQLVRDNTRVRTVADGYRQETRGTLIDYVITNSPDFISALEVDDEIGNSDHKLIIFNLKVKKDERKKRN